MEISIVRIIFMLIALQLSGLIIVTEGARLPGEWRGSKLAARGEPVSTQSASSLSSTVSPCTGFGCIAVNSPQSSLPCTEANGTEITSGNGEESWTLLCNIDFYAQDIYPFLLVDSFEECLQQCDEYNHQHQNERCASFVFAPDRTDAENDCYLKSSVNSIVYPSTIHLIGATLLPQPSSRNVESQSNTFNASVDGAAQGENETQIHEPVITSSKFLGTTTNEASKQYVSHRPALPMRLASGLLKPGINVDLVTNYPLAVDTGSWTESETSFGLDLANLSVTPRLSRDGGKGGTINGIHVFYFCDTSTYGDTQGPLGYMNGLVSSSAALAVSKGPDDDTALVLQDPIGQWQDDVGRLRGWIPMTTGEEGFNTAISGEGFRYAVWPESSFIQFNETHSIIYAPVVYVDVDMQTQNATFTSLGNTLILVSNDPTFGPHADRIINQLFKQNEIEWGSLGGIRAWTETGLGSNDGNIYLFGQVDGGVLLARVPAVNVADRSAYLYWDGASWTSEMLDRDSTAYLIKQSVMDFDLFYSPFHKYFFMVYLTPFADNTFYYRFLNTSQLIYPPYDSNGTADYVENILRYPWSDPIVLYKADAPAMGYIYAGGCHLGYYGSDDIANGGTYLLITWTEHTVVDSNDPSSGYAHKGARIQISNAGSSLN